MPDASDRLLQAADDLRFLERAKRTVAISSPEFHALADRIEQLARRISGMADREEELGDAAPPGPESIDDVAKGRRRPH